MFLQEASQAIAAGTGKPQQYVMVKLATGQPLLFAGSDEPAALLEVKSIGFPAAGVEGIAASLSKLVSKYLHVHGDRTYVVFEDVKAAMWGQGGEMFG